MSDDVYDTLDRLHHLGLELYHQGRYDEAIRYASQAYEIARSKLSEEHPAYAETLSNLGELYRSVGDYGAAEPLLQQALELRRRLPDVALPGLLDSLNNLGVLYFTTDKYEAAEPLYHEAVDIARAAYGTDHPTYATNLNNLGLLYVETGDYAAAEPLLRQALQIRQQSLGETDQLVAQSLSNLGNLYAQKGDVTQAEQFYQQALATYYRAVGDEHPEVGTALHNFALVYQRSCDLARAEPLFRQAIAVYRRTLGENHPYVATAQSNLRRVHEAQVTATAAGLTLAPLSDETMMLYLQGLQLRDQGRYAEAIPLLERYLQFLPRVTGSEEHPIYAKALADLATTHLLAGDLAVAEPLLQQALDVYRQTLGETHPHVAVTANNLGRLYLEKGDYARAEPLLRQAVDNMCQTGGKANQDTGTALNDLGMLYLHRGNVSAAEPLLREALEVYRRTVGEEHPYFRTTLDTLANLRLHQLFSGRGPNLERQISRLYEQAEQLDGQGRYAEAVPLVEQQLALTRQLMGGEDYPKVAAVLNNLALLYNKLGDDTSAEALMTQALDITQRTLGEADPAFAIRLNNLGMIRRALGDYAASLPLYERALAILRGAVGDDHLDVANVKNNLAGLYMAMGKYAAAEPLYQQALVTRMRHLGAAHRDVAELLDNLGWLYLTMEDYHAALRNAKQALDTYRRALGEHHPDVAITLGNLGLLHTALGDHAAAEPLIREALRITRAALGERHPATAVTLGRLAALYRAMRRYADAEQKYEEAMAIEREVLPADHPLLGHNLYNLAALRLEMGNPSAAAPLLQRSLEIQKAASGANHPDRAKGLYLLAWARAATGDTGEALELLNQAAAIDDRAIGQIFSIGSELQRMAYATQIWARCAFHLPLLLEQADRRTAGNTGLDLVLRRKALVAESVAVQRTAVLGGHYPELVPQLQELDSLRTRIGARTLGGGGAARYGNEQLIKAWFARRESLEAELARQIPEMSLQQHIRSADLQAVSQAIPAGAALIEFVRFDVFDYRAVRASGERWLKPAHYLAFVLHAGQPDDVRMIDVGEAEPIDELIAQFRAAITGRPEGQDRREEPPPLEGGELHRNVQRTAISDVARELRDLGDAEDSPVVAPNTDVGLRLRAKLWDLLLPALDGCTHVFLAPDGDLSRLPFEALPLTDGRYVLDTYQLSYLSVGRDLLRFSAQSAGQAAPALVVADPDFSLGAVAERPATTPFRRLAGTRVEGEQVAGLLRVVPRLDQDAQEGPLKESMVPGHSPHILHLATHGFFLPDQPTNPVSLTDPVGTPADGLARLTVRRLPNPLLRSGLALAGANTWLQGGNLPPEAEDGLLMAEDVTGLDLLNTEVVVLSACDTGLGDIHSGEGVFGLRRAFVLAGAKTLVMSLWKVPDHATQELMVDFYRRILKKRKREPRADALRAAQLALKKRYPHPRYWGAFICQGDPRLLSASSTSQIVEERICP